MLSKYGNCLHLLKKLKTNRKLVAITNKVGKNSRYFVGFFYHYKPIIPLMLVGYEMIANLALHALFAIYYLTFNAHLWNTC